jgi:hypothetical protein
MFQLTFSGSFAIASFASCGQHAAAAGVAAALRFDVHDGADHPGRHAEAQLRQAQRARMRRAATARARQAVGAEEAAVQRLVLGGIEREREAAERLHPRVVEHRAHR